MMNNFRKSYLRFASALAIVSSAALVGSAPSAAISPEAEFAGIAFTTPSLDGGCPLNSSQPDGFLARAVAMYADENYRGCADQLRLALKQLPHSVAKEKAEYLLARACAHIPGEDAEGLLTDFLENYPSSPYRTGALLALADILITRGEYATALELYRAIEPDALNPSDAEAMLCNEILCLLKFGNYTEARTLCRRLATTPRANDARFYDAYIDYAEGKYREALDAFSAVSIANTTPTSLTPYFLAQLHYRLGDYTEALSEARALIASGCPAEYLPEVQRIAGESFYQTGQPRQAVPLLRSYLSSVTNPAPSALFILGEDAYNNGNYTEAISLLTPATEGDNAMAQRAYLLIGQSYMQTDNFDSALLALDRAIKKDIDREVTETASYNYAVASSRGGKLPFASSITLFEQFLSTYPDSRLAPAVTDYVINGYITDRNYAAALAAINRVKRPSDKLLAAKQQVLYLHGARRLQAGNPEEATTLLTEARSLGRFSGETASEAMLWLGEANYRLGKYKEAEANYNTFLKETPSSNPNHALALYDMAYAQFALKQFDRAAEYITKFLKATDRTGVPDDVTALRADAYNRLGDCRYYASNLTAAAAAYDKAIATAPDAADYPMFQLAVMKGLQRDHRGKIEAMNAMMKRFPSSALIPSALLETGESYTELGETAHALEVYSSLAKRFPSTAQGRQGALLLAIGRLNSGETDSAIEAYKYVISTYPTSEEARAAADDLKHIYADRADIAAYTRFLATVPDAPKLQQGELSALQLESIEKAMEAGRENDALRLSSELLESFPDAPQAVEALAVTASLREKNGRPTEALDAYKLMETKASTEIDVNRARMGILRLSRDLGDNNAVLETSQSLLASSSLAQDDRSEVQLARALALLNTGSVKDADAILTQLAANPSTIAGAKASYYLGQSLFDRGNLDGAMTQATNLIDSNTPQEYWLARGFILLSDIYRRKGNTFEADEYLRSLRDNYPGNEADIFQMVESRLTK